MDFTGKVVIVTGASSGIGAATAKLFASYGGLLSVIGRNEERLTNVAAVCEAARGNRPLCILLDLTLNNSCEEIVRKTIETYGKIDVLINCAGKPLMTSLFDKSMDIFDELFALNLRVPYKLTQLCVPHLVKTKGNIVNVFGAPTRTRPGFIPYSMIKEALERFTKSAALELMSEGVRINAVRPGITRTNMLTNFNVDKEQVETVYSIIADQLVPNKNIIEPEEIAKMIVFAASDTCPNLNAANLIVDGALSLY